MPIHTHRFRQQGGETIIDDEVNYLLSLSPLGEIEFPFIRWQVGRIFAFREATVQRILLVQD